MQKTTTSLKTNNNQLHIHIAHAGASNCGFLNGHVAPLKATQLHGSSPMYLGYTWSNTGAFHGE
ncbi:MAG: hypothetical protein IKP00_01745 [Victivallales bacterium]|nr:hypothetical protein [Victivallales bacterium]